MKKVELFYTIADYEKFENTKLSLFNSDKYDLKKMRLFAERSDQKINNKKSQIIRKQGEKCERVEKKEISFFLFDISINTNKPSQLKSQQEDSSLFDEEKSTGDDSKNSEIIQKKEDSPKEFQLFDNSLIEEMEQNPLFGESVREEENIDDNDEHI